MAALALHVFNHTSASINSKADEEAPACFEWDDVGDMGVSGGDRSRVSDLFLFASGGRTAIWLEPLLPNSSSRDVIINLNLRSM